MSWNAHETWNRLLKIWRNVLDFIMIGLRNLSSAESKWKKYLRIIKQLLFFVCIKVDSFWISFNWFSSWYIFVNYCHLHSLFLKNLKVVVSTTFELKVICFSTQYGSLQNQFVHQTGFRAKPVFPRNQFPCEISFPHETSFPHKISSPPMKLVSPTKPVSL